MNEETQHWLLACRRATERLVRAAQARDAAAVSEAVTCRDHALRTLKDVSDGRLEHDSVARLHLGAEEAETALVRFREEVREELRRVVRGSKAIGGYAINAAGGSGLDRSG